MILRDRDANTAWEDEADGTLEERVYYCQNWRADVVALFGSNGHMLQQVRYDPYGVPFGIAKADINADGVLDSADSSLFVTLYNSGSGTHPFADWNLDGTLNSQDPIAYLNSYNADTALGYGVLGYTFSRAGGANRKAYAGYEIDPVLTGANGRESVYHVRHRVLLSELGRWNRRDPLGYVDGPSVYAYVLNSPIELTDPDGKCAGVPCGFTVLDQCTQTYTTPTCTAGTPLKVQAILIAHVWFKISIWDPGIEDGKVLWLLPCNKPCLCRIAGPPVYGTATVGGPICASMPPFPWSCCITTIVTCRSTIRNGTCVLLGAGNNTEQ